MANYEIVEMVGMEDEELWGDIEIVEVECSYVPYEADPDSLEATDPEDCKREEAMSRERDARLKKSEREKARSKTVYKPVYGEKCIRKKYVNGEFHSFEVTINYKRQEVFDEKTNRFVQKQVQERKTFYSLEDAIDWRNKKQNERIRAKRKNVEQKKYGATVMDAARAHYAQMEKQMKDGKVSQSYVEQLKLQLKHFERFFSGKRTTYVQHIDTQQIEDYFAFEENRGIARASILKYKSHLSAIWDYMLKDKVLYGVEQNVVRAAAVTAKKTEYKAAALNYLQIQELIREACKMEDPTFLYMVVISMTQGLRRGEMCGLMWKDINFETNHVHICHNRVQLASSEVLKMPKREKARVIELHKAGREVLLLYKEWQEKILGREVLPDEFVMQWEINLLQNYVCHTGKVSRRWKEIYAGINKKREKEKKEALPYGRIHDGRHTYITLSLQGVKKEEGMIVPPASYIQVFQSAGHSLPKGMQNMSTVVYNEDVNARWDVTRFWDEVLEISVAEEWVKAEAEREAAYEQMTEFQRDKLKAQKERRLEKARQERLKGNPPEDVLQEYE